MNRRHWLYAASFLGTSTGMWTTSGLAAVQIPASASAAPEGARIPQMKFVYECDATLSPTIPFGTTVEGTRRIIPITGGTVKGPLITAEVLSIGADWNVSRTDGAGSVEAAYHLRTDDGVVVRVVNKGVGTAAAPRADAAESESFFMFTTPVFEAPPGKYDWMNRSTFVGTLGSRHGVHNAVLIRVFQVV